MSKLFLLTLIAWCTVSNLARAEEPWLDVSSWQRGAELAASDQGLDWRVGDKANYKIVSSLITGKSEQYVREDGPQGIWVNVNVDMGFLGTQRMEILYDKSNGQIKKLLVNGREQSAPNPADLDLIETHPDHLRVAAGEFDCTYTKHQNRNDHKFQEGWINSKLIPITGQIRAIGDSQIGKVTQELVSFSFAPRN